MPSANSSTTVGSSVVHGRPETSALPAAYLETVSSAEWERPPTLVLPLLRAQSWRTPARRHVLCDFRQRLEGLKVPYLISLDDTVNYMMVVKVKSRQAEHLLEAFTQMANAYKSYGWRVRVIRTDREASFRAIEPNLNGLGIQCEYTGRGMHERRAERAIIVIKERVQILRCTQVYKLPARLNEAAVIDIVMTLNMTPNKRSGTRSPREVVTGKKVNAPKDIRIEFGQLVQVKDPNQPSSDAAEESRVEDGIVVGRDPNANGSLRIFLLGNFRIVSRSTFMSCHITPTVCKTLNELADHD